VRRARELSRADQAEWDQYARLVRPLPGRRLPDPEPVALAVPVERPAPSPLPPSRPAATKPLEIGSQPGGVDRAAWMQLRNGRMPPARKLDLHGHSAERALQALEAFLLRAQRDHLRCVEIITGIGAGEEGGVLRRELPHWLNLPRLRPLLLGAAHPHPANPGATRLLLRRPR